MSTHTIAQSTLEDLAAQAGIAPSTVQVDPVYFSVYLRRATWRQATRLLNLLALQVAVNVATSEAARADLLSQRTNDGERWWFSNVRVDTTR